MITIVLLAGLLTALLSAYSLFYTLDTKKRAAEFFSRNFGWKTNQHQDIFPKINRIAAAIAIAGCLVLGFYVVACLFMICCVGAHIEVISWQNDHF